MPVTEVRRPWSSYDATDVSISCPPAITLVDSILPLTVALPNEDTRNINATESSKADVLTVFVIVVDDVMRAKMLKDI